jgi:hypothetical protein
LSLLRLKLCHLGSNGIPLQLKASLWVLRHYPVLIALSVKALYGAIGISQNERKRTILQLPAKLHLLFLVSHLRLLELHALLLELVVLQLAGALLGRLDAPQKAT